MTRVAVSSAVILAAGMGTRLRGELEDRPKGFLELGDRPIISESIERLAGANMFLTTFSWNMKYR